MNFLSNKKRSARMRPDACGICLLKQTASGAKSVTSPSKIEGFREFEADLSALFLYLGRIVGVQKHVVQTRRSRNEVEIFGLLL